MSAYAGTVLDALQRLHDFRTVLDGALSEAVHEIGGDPVVLCGLLLGLREVRQGIATAEAYVERAAGQAMRSDLLVVDSAFTAERRKGRDRKEWQHDDVAHAVVQSALVDPTTGELIGDVDTAWKVRDAFLNAARPEWRIRPLQSMGIDPDDYCISSPGRTTVAVTRHGGDVTE